MFSCAADRHLTRCKAVVILTVATIALLIPFVNKAFNIDDPLFLWIAQQIHSHPFDPYGFKVNWYDSEASMDRIMQNPPLASYYMALIARMFGWGEVVMHVSFLLVAILVVVGTYFVADRVCKNPLWAGVITLTMPVFLISSTTVMCDIMMLALWVWAVEFWLKGMQRGGYASYILSSLLMAACVLTKYYGISLILLLSAYTVIKKRGLGLWAAYFLLPIASLLIYQHRTVQLYGHNLLLDSCRYATIAFNINNMITNGFNGLCFTGGCLFGLAFFLPFLWSRKALAMNAILYAAFLLLFYFVKQEPFFLYGNFSLTYLQKAQYVLFVMMGIHVVLLAVAGVRERIDPESILLFLWICGAIVFSSFINWTINGRSILPALPAVAIMAVRRIEMRAFSLRRRRFLCVAVIPAALLSLLVTYADFRFAQSAREAASRISEKYGGTSANVYFQGHWGFQYYMQLKGYKPVDRRRRDLKVGYLVVVPENNDCMFFSRYEKIELQETLDFAVCKWVSTMNHAAAAGFYANLGGPLPFSIGPVHRENYYIVKITDITQ